MKFDPLFEESTSEPLRDKPLAFPIEFHINKYIDYKGH